MKKINLSEPIIFNESLSMVNQVLKSGWLTQGNKVAELEALVAEFLDVKYSLALNSATAGLHASLLALGVRSGDEVIVPSFTWVSTANAVEMCGAKPIFADIDINTFNILEEDLLKKISSKTKAIIPVHLFGYPCDIEMLKSLIPKSIHVVEDAACSLGSKLKGLHTGTLGSVGVFSFHPRKSITTGEGGMLVTNDKDIHEQVSKIRNHGQAIQSAHSKPYDLLDCPIVGYNYRMPDINAAVGISQFKKLEQMIDERNTIAEKYKTLLGGLNKVKLPQLPKDGLHSWQSYIIRVSSSIRNKLITFLADKGIQTRPGTHAVHTLSFYKTKYELSFDYCPNSFEALQTTIALPMHNNLIDSDITYISDKILEFFNNEK
ncbi:MAG: perosamine synthetase [Rickettsiales bacterium]|nr:perosamine synthetase [Rickettsiales bacterium]|tara:strand:+ start:11540 stop:12667 length:1128 start_codon:yes stop_codon:yes gene_type:complete